MMVKKYKSIIILFILILILFALNYSFIDSFLVQTFEIREKIHIDRVIDGDTVVSNGTSLRLLGINTPERGEKYYKEAKEFLENLILNKTVTIESNGLDKYKRELAYLFYKNQNVNLQLVENGWANFYFPSGKDIYYSQFQNAWQNCLNKNINLCEKSRHRCSECLVLKNFNYRDEIIILENKCEFSCELTDWTIKDEGRKKFTFSEFFLYPSKTLQIVVGEGTDTQEKLFWKNENYVWTKSGDTMFLRDKDGGLIAWENY